MAAPPDYGRLAPSAARSRSSSNVWLFVTIPIIAVLALTVAGAGILIARPEWSPFSRRPDSPPAVAATPPVVAATPSGAQTPSRAPVTVKPSSSSEPTSTTTYAAAVRGSLVRFARAHAPATSKSSTDGLGYRTSYEAANMLDQDPSTCWRMNGNGTATTLTFRFDHPRPVSTLGLINGYAKTDPATGEDRYSEERRIKRVTWTLGQQSFVQYLEDDEWLPQQFTLDEPVVAGTIKLRIDGVTGSAGKRFDRTAISDVVLEYD